MPPNVELLRRGRRTACRFRIVAVDGLSMWIPLAWLTAIALAIAWLAITSLPVRKLVRHLSSNSTGITVGSAEHYPWAALREIRVETTAAGPHDDDFFVVLELDGRARPVRIPEPLVQRVLSDLQGLPGFDNDQFLRAIGSTSKATFLCWRRS